MFKTLMPLIQSCGELKLTLSATENGLVKVIIVPGDGKTPELSQPLFLSATPEEMDAGFVAAITGYQASHQSLSEQMEATRAIMDIEKEKSAKKAVDSVSKKTGKAKPAKTAVSPCEADDENDPGETEDGDDDANPEMGAEADSNPASDTPAKSSDSNDLSSLFG